MWKKGQKAHTIIRMNSLQGWQSTCTYWTSYTAKHLVAFVLKTLYNTVEDPFKKLSNFAIWHIWQCLNGQINTLEHKSLDSYAVTSTICADTNWHINFISGDRKFCNTAVYGEKLEWSLNDFHFFKALNDCFTLQFFQGFIFRLYQRH